jgi:hypothetical protein
MQYTIRQADRAAQPFLWEMLYHAAHMADDGAGLGSEIKEHPDRGRYVAGGHQVVLVARESS